MKIVYGYHPDTGELAGETVADESPLEPGVYLIPACATDVEPPQAVDGKRTVWVGGEWVQLDKSTEENPIQEEPNETVGQTVARYEAALDAHLDSVARSYRYDNRFTFALRAGYAGVYHDEGVAFAVWMDTCNIQSYELMEKVIRGEAEMPTVSEFIALLPEFVFQP